MLRFYTGTFRKPVIILNFLGNRQRRIDTDLVQDNTENQILKELETISGVKATLTECLRNARDQLTASREAKHNLEMDWSDKVTLKCFKLIHVLDKQLFNFLMRHFWHENSKDFFTKSNETFLVGKLKYIRHF